MARAKTWINSSPGVSENMGTEDPVSLLVGSFTGLGNEKSCSVRAKGRLKSQVDIDHPRCLCPKSGTHRHRIGGRQPPAWSTLSGACFPDRDGSPAGLPHGYQLVAKFRPSQRGGGGCSGLQKSSRSKVGAQAEPASNTAKLDDLGAHRQGRHQLRALQRLCPVRQYREAALPNMRRLAAGPVPRTPGDWESRV